MTENEVLTQEDEIDLANFKKQLRIRDLEGAMLQMEQVECPVNHHFGDGTYVRETHMPAGTFAVGKRHRFKVVNILLKGEITVYNGEKEGTSRMKAPCIFTSEPGIKKMAYFHEDTVWLNIHPAEETDVDKIEEKVLITDSEYFGLIEGEKLWPGLQQQ